MKYWFYYFVKFTVWSVFRSYNRLEVRGQHRIPKTGPFILACNHVSFIDPPVVAAACSRRLVFMARADLFHQPLLAAFMRGVHVISLVRGETDLGAIREAVRRLGQGDVVTIFPEGGRQPTGQLSAAKRGVGVLAAAARVPIIPVYIQGTFKALPRDERCLSPKKIRVAFGEPIPYTTDSVPSPASSSGTGSAEGAPERTARYHHEQLAEAVTTQWRRLEHELSPL